MKKMTKKAPTGAKVVCVLLTLCMLFSLTACGGGSSYAGPETPDEGAGMATSTNTQISQIPGPGVDEPHHVISSGAEIEVGQPTTVEPVQSAGQYSYTIYDGVVINMDINVDDYIIVNKAGEKVFKIYDLAHDRLGWEGTRQDEYGYLSDGYTLNGNSVYLIPYTDTKQLYSFTYSYSLCRFAYRDNMCDYKLSGTLYKASYDDIVLLSYTLWLGATNSESNPFEVLGSHYTLGYVGTDIEVNLP